MYPFLGQKPTLSDSVRAYHSFPLFCFLLLLLWLLTAPGLPPGEEGSSALETLCVGLTVSSLRRSGCLNDYGGHLNQLEGRFTVLQGLAQVQDL